MIIIYLCMISHLHEIGNPPEVESDDCSSLLSSNKGKLKIEALQAWNFHSLLLVQSIGVQFALLKPIIAVTQYTIILRSRQGKWFSADNA